MKAPITQIGSILRAGVLGLVMTAAFAFSTTTASAQSYEKIRAIFLFNFAKHVEWPDAAFTDAKAPITIGVLDEKAIARELEKYVRGKDANGRDIEVKQITSPADAGDCQMVYIADKKQAAAFIEAFDGKPVLTVGEQSDFTDLGGMIKLFEKNKKVGCFVNVTASTKAGLKMSSKLVAAKK